MEKFVIRQAQEMPSLLEYANKNRHAGYFNDITITVENKSFPANRMVLSCFSRYFERLFKTEMKERYGKTIPMHNVEEKSMELLIEFMYTGCIKIDSETVMPLLAAADYLLLDEVKTFCFEFLQSIICSDSWFAILSAANLYRNDALSYHIHSYIGDNLDGISQTDDFKSLSKEVLGTCFSSIALSEKHSKNLSLYQAIISWTKHDVDARKPEFVSLFQLVNLEQLPKDFLLSAVATEELILSNPACSQRAMTTLASLIKETEADVCLDRFVSLGGVHNGTKVVEIYNTKRELPSEFPDLPFSINRHASLILNKVVYCIGGGSKDNFITDKVRRLKLQDVALRWTEISPMNVKRRSMGAAVYQDLLLVAGGFDGNTALDSVECYTPQWDEWKLISSLKQARSGCGVVACDDFLYTLGGCCDGNCLSSVERLCEMHEPWSKIQPMQTQRWRLAVVNCDGIIYAIGGKSGNNYSSTLKTVEKYDAAFNQWVYVSGMKNHRCVHSASVSNGKIYVFGGLNAENKVVKDVECYDPRTDEWTIVSYSPEKLIQNSIVVL